MSDAAHVIKKRAPPDQALLDFLKHRSATARAASHGNYLPALDKALELLRRVNHPYKHPTGCCRAGMTHVATSIAGSRVHACAHVPASCRACSRSVCAAVHAHAHLCMSEPHNHGLAAACFLALATLATA